MYSKFCSSLNENQIIVPSYQHYGGNSGFQDYGILGLKIKNKLLTIWRELFLTSDIIDEVETPTIMPPEILKKSGHVDRFTDYVVEDDKGNWFRADHLVQDYFLNNLEMASSVEGMGKEQLEDIINTHKLVSGENRKVITKNLMFALYDSESISSYLRPELAQGIFVNFKIFHQFYHYRNLPFGICQIGKSYRNEITTKQFTRLREFTQAEIEYFVDPDQKDHHLFDAVKFQVINLFPASLQLIPESTFIKITIEEACNHGLISNRLMGYFLGRIQEFSIKIGLNPDKIRFRQHLDTEKAHYSSECWDLETFVNNRWLECVGVADRGDYDLKAHSNDSNRFTFKRSLPQPIIKQTRKIKINKSIVGKKFKSLFQDISTYFETVCPDMVEQMLKTSGQITILDNVTITSDMIQFVSETEEITTQEVYPHVIEPSFGIDRLLYSVFQHNFWSRDDKNRIVLSLPKCLSPYDVAIFQLYNRSDMMKLAQEIKFVLLKEKFNCYIDNSNVTIGKRYCRLDEIGVKYAITIDPGSLDDHMVTVRERDSMNQIRVPISNITKTLLDLV